MPTSHETDWQRARFPRRTSGAVLVVCANRNAAQSYGEIFEAWGMRVQIAYDHHAGLEAIARSTSGDPPLALAVIDQGVSSTAGLELAERLRRDPATRKLPIVMLIPPGQIHSLERCRQVGIRHCLSKPASAGELARAVAAALGTRPQPRTPPQAEVPGAIARSLRVLVADDSPVNQQVAAGLLRLRGHTAEAVGNGREAVEALARVQFDMILMDIEMPEMDGLAATAAIRALEEQSGRARTPIFAMTAHAIQGFEDQCLAAGMDGYILKPIQPHQLFGALETVARSAESVTA